MNLRMVVTVVTGEVESTALTKMTETERFYQQLRFEKRGFEVYTNGDISGFSFDSIGAKGSCCNKLSPSEMKRLEVLTARLPTDRGRLPPPGERVVVQTTRGKQWKVRVYDRSKASPEIGQILELIDKRH